MNNQVLFKPNSIIMATSNCSEITSTEYKVYDTVLQKCQVYQGYGFKKAQLGKDEVKSIVKNKNDLTVKGICDIFEKFRNITMRFKIGTKYITSSAISEYSYDESNNMFSVYISDNVFNMLMDYAQIGYSPIDLKLVRKAKSYYTQKIYGMLRMWSRYNETVFHTYKLTEIKDICDIVEGSCYDQYKIFKRDILKKSLKEIQNKLNMKAEIVKENRVSRKVASIEFSILDYETKKYDFDSEVIIEAKDIQQQIKAAEPDIDEEISSIDYVNLIDMNLKASIHKKFMNDFGDYKNYLRAVETASSRTLNAVGGKTINSRNYNYFKTALTNLIAE